MGAFAALASVMRRWAFGLAAAVALGGCDRAPDEPAVQASPALWAVYAPGANDDAQTPDAWLFGTIHALPPGVAWRTPRLDTAIRHAGVLAVEVAGLDDDGDAIAATFRRMAQDRPPAAPLVRRADPDLRDELALLLARSNISAPGDGMETWAAALMLARLAQEGDPALGVDRALIEAFDARLVLELEGAQAQFAVFDALPEQEQRDLLNAVIVEASEPAGLAGRLGDAWMQGDTEQIEMLSRRGMLADPELREALLDRRNRAWAAAIVRLIEDGRRPLVAVGAGHMIGSAGLPALLIRQGYRVRRVQ